MDVFGLEHIDLTVNDMQRSLAFYELVLGELGFSRVADDDYVALANAHMGVGLREAPQAEKEARFDRYRVGLHHLALRAASRADVDRFHGFLVEHGVTVLDAPAEYPEYGPGYYAVFFADPDGMKLELVHFPWGYWRRVQTDGRDERPRYAPKVG